MSRTSRKLILLLAIVLGLGGNAFAATSTPLASVTITGGERSSGGVWDSGTVTVTINGHAITIAYGQFSTPAGIASGLGATISQTCSMPVYAHAVGSVLTFYRKGTNVITSASLSSTSSNTSLFPGTSFLIDGTGGGVSLPTISLSASSGTPGSSLTISAGSGTSFGASQGSSTVSLGSTTVTPSSWSASTIVVTVPSTLVASIYPVSVTVNSTATFAVPFTVLPQVTNVSFDSADNPIPAANLATSLSGPPQVGFVIVGAGFGASDNAANTYVTLNGVELNTLSWSNNEIIVQVPASFAAGGPYAPVVTVAGISSNGSVSFQVVGPLGCAN